MSAKTDGSTCTDACRICYKVLLDESLQIKNPPKRGIYSFVYLTGKRALPHYLRMWIRRVTLIQKPCSSLLHT